MGGEAAPEQTIADGLAAAFARFREDIARELRQTTRLIEALSVGEAAAVGQTPNEVIWQEGTARLRHYRASAASVRPVPLLLVHSLISKPYILDLIPGNSFVEYLVQRGFDLYLIDWGAPRFADRGLRLEDYTLDLLPRAITAMLARARATAFSLFGYCLGGLLALLYAASHPAAPLRNLITLATPIDFSAMGLQARLAQADCLDVDRLVDTLGNIPAALIRQSFQLLKPASNELSPARCVALWQHALDDRYVAQYLAFDRWTREHIPFPGECFRQLVTALVRANALCRGVFALHDQPVTLSAITCSFLAVAAAQDHIVPPAATICQRDLVGSADKALLVMPGGHVGLAAGRKAKETLWPQVAAWLGERSGHDPASSCTIGEAL